MTLRRFWVAPDFESGFSPSLSSLCPSLESLSLNVARSSLTGESSGLVKLGRCGVFDVLLLLLAPEAEANAVLGGPRTISSGTMIRLDQLSCTRLW